MIFNKYLLLVLTHSLCVAQKAELINNSDSARISPKHFESSQKEKVYFEYFPGVKSNVDCNGIYFYRYISKSMPQLLYRDANGRTYSKYFLFIIIDGEIISLLKETDRNRERFYESNKKRFEKEFGTDKVVKLKDAIIKGYEIFY
jgi:hypothetical protein